MKCNIRCQKRILKKVQITDRKKTLGNRHSVEGNKQPPKEKKRLLQEHPWINNNKNDVL